MAAVLVDASALVALLDRRDRAHQRCVEALATVHDSLVTCWPALTETMHLFGGTPRAQDAVFDMIEDSALYVAQLDADDLPRMKALMRKYRDLPMDFADAALVRIAERDRLMQILSLDRHFRVYTLPGRARFVILP